MLYEFKSKRPCVAESAYVSDSATLIGEVYVGERCYIGPGAILRADMQPIYVGDETAVEDGVIIHAGSSTFDGCHIGKRVTLGHGAIIHGRSLGDGCNIGMGAIISINAQLGEYCVVAEGAVVKKGQIVPPKVVVGGAPAKLLRELEDRDIDIWESSKQAYIDLATDCNTPGVLKRIH